MRAKLCVVSASTNTRYIRLGVTDCARVLVGDYNSGEYNLYVTDNNAVIKHPMRLEAGWQRSVWVTTSEG